MAALFAVLAGCEALRAPASAPATSPVVVREAAPAPPPPAPVVVFVPKRDEGDRAVRQLLEYDARLSMMDLSELRREIARLGDGKASPDAAMDLALALGHTRSNGDAARAQGLLERVLRDGTAQAQQWHSVARLLWSRYAAQRGAEEQVERLGQQLRDNQRDNQRKLEQLNEKLEALRAIERSLINRQPPGAAPTPLPSPSQTPARPAP